MPRKAMTKAPSGVSRKARATAPDEVVSAAIEAAPPTLRTPVFSDFDDVEETFLAMDEAAHRGPRRTVLTSPRRDVG